MSAASLVNKGIGEQMTVEKTTLDHTQVKPKKRQSSANQKAGREKKAYAKTDYRHWLPRISKPLVHGKESPSYGVRFEHRGERWFVSLGLPEKEDAAKKAARIWCVIHRDGMDAAKEQFRPAVAERSGTVGALIEAFNALSTAKRISRDNYAAAMRLIASEIAGVERDKSRFDYVNGGNLAWRKKVDAIKLDRITPASVKAWQVRRLREAGPNEVERGHAAVSVNATIRNARALFSAKLLAHLREKVALPSPLPFEGIQREAEPSSRYQSSINVETLLADSQEELVQFDPEAFKLLVLTYACGLRLSEADALRWDQVNFIDRTIEIRDTETRHIKSRDSKGTIDVDDQILSLMKIWHARAKGDFVLELGQGPLEQSKRNGTRLPSFVKPRTEKAVVGRWAGDYRVPWTHKRLREWLRSKGVDTLKPIHTGRKEVGSVLASRDGIFAAQRYLRHSSPEITSRFYADQKQRITPGLGAAFMTSSNPTEHHS